MRSNNLADPEKYVYEHNTRSACPRDGMATTCRLLQESVVFESRHQRGAWNRPLGCGGGGQFWDCAVSSLRAALAHGCGSFDVLV
jgi:hypothetical protein